ncbi:electron transport complex subunit RsxC [Feifania hominis]|uniref:Ion-translocating oxidoreductase complex subunit C n=1 Tax=Feifania hominis TaxID=2763660 RepID=A0A926D9X3_9FIRM|nr:electron transport complex subunit RsxC [Feifania hominis]MBC8535090.1 electron transport complex subunit RsxC [Feifania hominis]
MRNILKRSALGAAVPHEKGTAACETQKLPLPGRLVLPMAQHIGAPAAVAVEKGDRVLVGSLVGRAEGSVSANIHSGVSGEVSEIGEIMMPNGTVVPAVTIIPDGEQQTDPSVRPPEVNDYKSFVEAVRASGLVGLGGAGFPTAVKLSPKNPDEVKILIVNGAECEPFLTADTREMLECTADIIAGVKAVKKHMNLERVIIAVERNKPEAIAAMRAAIDDAAISLKVLPSRYPQGAEKILIEKCTGREVPQGGLPGDVGVLVMNVASAGFLGRYLETGMPLVTRRLTVDGDAVEHPKNVEAVVGTPVEEVLAFCGLRERPAKVMAGGPMMGTCLVSTDFPIIKQNNGILAFTEASAHLPEPKPCIRCGRCINGCPMGLSPVEIASAFSAENIDALAELKTDLCMECGTCTYVCPAKRPVTQTVRLAKDLLRKGGKKNG